MPAPPDTAAHARIEAQFRDGLVSGTIPTGVTARHPDETARRFAVYRNNVAHGLVRAVSTRFPVIERLVGAAFLGAMARVFIDLHPPRSPLMLAYGDQFPAFLENFPPVAGLPYLPDVARLELARGRAYHAADAAPVPRPALARAAAAGGALRLGLHPSVEVLASRWPVFSIWAANQPDADGSVSATGPETGLVARNGADRVIVVPLSPAASALVSALSTDPCLSAATQRARLIAPDFDPAETLGLLIAAGLIATATAGEPT